jgi:RNA polymerase sigma factor (sigma-70 family)
MPLNSEALLSQALRSGEPKAIEEAFGTIYAAYAKLVSFCVAKYIPDPETVKDLTNDVFLSFFQNASHVRGSIKYYLLQSARNAAISRAQKNGRLAFTDESELLPDESTLQSAPFYSELVASLRLVLSEKELRIVLLHAVEGYTFKEVGALLAMSEGAANVAYFRAIRKYRKAHKEVVQ